MCSRILYINIHLHFIKYLYMFIIFSISLKTFCFEKHASLHFVLSVFKTGKWSEKALPPHPRTTSTEAGSLRPPNSSSPPNCHDSSFPG